MQALTYNGRWNSVSISRCISATKYLNGHSDIIGGVVVAGDNTEVADRLAFLQNAVGGIAGPFDSFLANRGLKTLHLRMQRHCENALEIAKWLESHPRAERVIYPGLPSHPQHSLAKQQMSGFGGMVTLILTGDLASTRRFLERCEVFSLAESLGGVESLIEHPAIMTHASIPPEQRAAIGISDTLVRLSVGVEDVSDLIRGLGIRPGFLSSFRSFRQCAIVKPMRFLSLFLLCTTVYCANDSYPTPRFTDPQRTAKFEAAFPEIDRIFGRYASERNVPGMVWAL